MKKLSLIIAIVFSGIMMQSQEVATYNQVAEKKVKGNITQYTAESGVVFHLGDTVRIGCPCRKTTFDFINDRTNIYMSGWVGSCRISRARYDEASGQITLIKSMRATGKKLYVTTYSGAESLRFNITNFEEALKHGEVVKPGFKLSDEALTNLQESN
jgi:hypothetical protein